VHLPSYADQNAEKFRGKTVFSQSPRKYGKSEKYSNNTFPGKNIFGK